MRKSQERTECVALYKDNVFGVSKDRNVIFRISCDNKKTEVVACIPEEDFFAKRLVGHIEVYYDDMIFVPATASKIWIWNLRDNTWNGIELENIEMKGNIKFLASFLHDDRLYMFGCHYPAIVELSLKDRKVIYHKSFLKDIKSKVWNLNDAYFRSGFVYVNDKIYLASCVDNRILEFDLNTKQGNWFFIGEAGDRFSGIAYDGNSFWISPRIAGYAYQWNGKDCMRYSINEGEKVDFMSFVGINCDHEGNVVIPNLEHDYMFIKSPDSDSFNRQMHIKYDAYESTNDNIIKITRDSHIRIIKENSEKIDLMIECEPFAIKKIMNDNKAILQIQNLIIEDDLVNLEMFLQLVN